MSRLKPDVEKLQIIRVRETQMQFRPRKLRLGLETPPLIPPSAGE